MSAATPVAGIRSGNAAAARQAAPTLTRGLEQLDVTNRKNPPMRHAAPTPSTDRKLNRAGQLVFAGIAYAIAGLATALITLATTLAIWGLWQWLGVN